MNVNLCPEILWDDVLFWEAEDEKLFAKLREMEDMMLEMEVDDESESFN